jgi:hypothetical protein
MLERWLTQLSQQLDVPMTINQELPKSYLLILNQETHLLLKDLNPGFSCRSLIAPLPQEENLEDLFILCMRANFLGQGTKGAAIAIDPSLQHFLFTLTVTEELTSPLFKETIEDFVNYLNYWKKRIGSRKSSGTC